MTAVDDPSAGLWQAAGAPMLRRVRSDERQAGRGALRGWAGSGADSSGTACGEASDQLADDYLRHGAAVYGLVRNVAGTAAAEQVTVDVFLALARMPRDLRDGTRSLRTWLLALAHRQAVHVLRSDPDRRSRLAAVAPSDVERAL